MSRLGLLIAGVLLCALALSGPPPAEARPRIEKVKEPERVQQAAEKVQGDQGLRGAGVGVPVVGRTGAPAGTEAVGAYRPSLDASKYGAAADAVTRKESGRIDYRSDAGKRIKVPTSSYKGTFEDRIYRQKGLVSEDGRVRPIDRAVYQDSARQIESRNLPWERIDTRQYRVKPEGRIPARSGVGNVNWPVRQ